MQGILYSLLAHGSLILLCVLFKTFNLCNVWQVSDLDGTMVGEGREADTKTQDFCTYWESNAALAGGILVYNTGRSLGGFISLMKEKEGALALPDVLITAVGTKVTLHHKSFKDIVFWCISQGISMPRDLKKGSYCLNTEVFYIDEQCSK